MEEKKKKKKEDCAGEVTHIIDGKVKHIHAVYVMCDFIYSV